MDVDFYASRVHSAKHFSAMQAARRSSETHLCLHDSEGDDDVRACFSCPFCYVDIEIPVLRTYLLPEEHYFNVKNDVCPVCAADLGKDMIGHFTVQHLHLLKRRKSQRTGLWTNTSAIPGKELRELSSFLGVASSNLRGNTPESAPDPLISSFFFGLALPDAKVDQHESAGLDESVASTSLDRKSTQPSTSDGYREEDKEEMRQKAEFVQQLMLSTIF